MALMKQFTTSNYRFTTASLMIKIRTAGCLVKRHQGMHDSCIFNGDELTRSDNVITPVRICYEFSHQNKKKKKDKRKNCFISVKKFFKV